MKDPFDVLRVKEQELLKVKIEIEALRIAVLLLGEESPAAANQISAIERVDLRKLVEMP